MTTQLLHGDCRNILKVLANDSIDSCVTDPPYHLTTKSGGKAGFMGAEWDGGGVAFDSATWAETLRVMKPGAHLLAFGGTRTYHRLVCAIEDAGFEIRDQIGWLYLSGFPKSLDVSKALDKMAGVEREVGGIDRARHARLKNQIHGSVSTGEQWQHGKRDVNITAPATDAARQWEGWGTALKPCFEPIVVARKPLAKGNTIAANVLQHGTGAINIGACRVETSDDLNGGAYSETRKQSDSEWAASGSIHEYVGSAYVQPLGRWPANIIHDGSDEIVALFPESKGQQGDVKGTEPSGVTNGIYGKFNGRVAAQARIESGVSAARFFYAAKASKADRGDGNTHPTVKPMDLMRYLCRLVTPPGGTVLDQFAGSGSTLLAADLEGFNSVGIELLSEHIEIIKRRLFNLAPLFAEQL